MSAIFNLYSNFYLKVTVAMLFCVLIYPVIENFQAGAAAISLIDISMMLMAIRFTHNSPRSRWLLLLIASLAVGLDAFDIFVPIPQLKMLTSVFFCGFYMFAIYAMLKYVLSPGLITLDRLCASLAIYMTMALFWALIYRLYHLASPSAFRFDARIEHPTLYDFVYFSFATLTTTGYGDIVPATHQAQAFTIVEQMVGVLYVAILVARLTSLYSPKEHPPSHIRTTRRGLLPSHQAEHFPRGARGGDAEDGEG